MLPELRKQGFLITIWYRRRRKKIQIREKEAGDSGGDVVKYSGWGMCSMGGREIEREGKKTDKKGTGKGMCEELKAA